MILAKTPLLFTLVSVAAWAQVNIGEQQSEAGRPFATTTVTALLREPSPLRSAHMAGGAILDILREQSEAWNRGDGVAWAKEFTDDCDFVNLRGEILHGRADVGTSAAAGLQRGMKGSHLSLTLRQFNLLTPDIALVDTDYDFTGIQGVLPGVAVTDGVLKTRLKYIAV